MKKTVAVILAALLALSAFGTALAQTYTDKATVKQVQQALNDAGYNCGTPDGAAGKKTKAAIESYQTDHGFEVTGAIDDALLAALGLAEDAEDATGVIDDALMAALGLAEDAEDATGVIEQEIPEKESSAENTQSAGTEGGTSAASNLYNPKGFVSDFFEMALRFPLIGKPFNQLYSDYDYVSSEPAIEEENGVTRYTVVTGQSNLNLYGDMKDGAFESYTKFSIDFFGLNQCLDATQANILSGLIYEVNDLYGDTSATPWKDVLDTVFLENDQGLYDMNTEYDADGETLLAQFEGFYITYSYGEETNSDYASSGRDKFNLYPGVYVAD